MKIDIICVGKIKEKFYRDALDEYMKRLGKYCKPKILEVEDEKTPDKASPVQEAQIKAREAERILNRMRQDAYVITLEIQGQKLDSIAFSNMIEQAGVQGKSQLQFIIGGSLGLHESVSRLAARKISFSDMTFPHQLMRIILAEQIYRGYRIISGEPYHK